MKKLTLILILLFITTHSYSSDALRAVRGVEKRLRTRDPATGFFRHTINPSSKQNFDIFVEGLAKRAEGGEVIRILCVGCSTGEEIYTLAMVLLEKGLDAENIEILGMDIQRKLIFQAVKGVYPKKRVVHVPGNMAAKYFARIDNSNATVSRELRRVVDFTQSDVTDASQVAGLGKFDGITFRHVSYQLTKPGELRKAFSNLAEVSKEGALFFTTTAPGDSEGELFVKDSLSSTGFVKHAKAIVSSGYEHVKIDGRPREEIEELWEAIPKTAAGILAGQVETATDHTKPSL